MAATKSTDRAGAICPAHGKKHDRGNNTDRGKRGDKMVAIHGSTCVYCGGEGREQERIVESCYYVLANLIPSCGACNKARGNRFDTLAWLAVCKTPVRACEAIRVAASQKVRLNDPDFYARLNEIVENLPY